MTMPAKLPVLSEISNEELVSFYSYGLMRREMLKQTDILVACSFPFGTVCFDSLTRLIQTMRTEILSRMTCHSIVV